MSRIVVLRLGHRIHRDIRITTHVALTARAFGADKIIISGDRDERLIERLKKIVEKWGGDFNVEYEEDWRRSI
ncbi:MAG: tRNA (cytidine(56)-2'-O)-methyltransferase, partial [Nitrososphaerota archaeon]